MLTESLEDIKRLAGLVTEAGDPFAELDKEEKKMAATPTAYQMAKQDRFANMVAKFGEEAVAQMIQTKILDKKLAAKQKAQVQQAKPKPDPRTLDTYGRSGVQSAGGNPQASASKLSAHKHETNRIAKAQKQAFG